MAFAAASWVFVIVFFGVTLLSVFEDRQSLNVLARFRRYMTLRMGPPDRPRFHRTFHQRMIRPVLDRVRALINTQISESLRRTIQMKLLNAGCALRVTPEEYLMNAAGRIAGLGAAAAAVQYSLGFAVERILFNSVLVAALGAALTVLLLDSKIRRRIFTIERELPELLDYIQVAVEAGLSVDVAVERIVREQSKSIMAGEFRIYLNAVAMGLPRMDALHELNHRTRSRYVKNFTDGIVQSVKTGIPTGNILQIVRRDIYDDIRTRAEKKAYRAPVLMMIPMILFIFPIVFIITLAPTLMKLMSGVGTLGVEF